MYLTKSGYEDYEYVLSPNDSGDTLTFTLTLARPNIIITDIYPSDNNPEAGETNQYHGENQK